MAAKGFNIAQVKLNGVAYGTKPGATARLGGVSLSPDFADGDQLVMYETPEPMEVSCSFIVTSDTDLEAIRNFKNGVCEFVLKDLSGTPTYSSADASVAESVQLSAGDGISVRIIGKPMEKTA